MGYQARRFLFKVFNLFTAIVAVVFALGNKATASNSSLWPKLVVKNVTFISDDYENTSSKNFTLIGGSILDHSGARLGFSYGVDLKAYYGIDAEVLSYMNVRELYLGYSWVQNGLHNLSFGRKISDWSLLDEMWNLGFYQPQLRWNSLDLETQGLVGFYYDYKMKLSQNFTLSATAFYSPLFIPDQGPGYELKNGGFLKTNPWFQPPPTRVEFQNQNFEIDYNIQMPQITDVLFQNSFGGRIRLEMPYSFYTQVSALNKASHQLALGFKAALVADRVKVEILPRVYREELYGLDLGFKNEWTEVSLGAISVKPKTIVYDAPYNYPVMEDSLSWGPKWSLNYEAWGLWAGALFTEGKNFGEEGPDKGTMQTPLTLKYLYNRAYKVGISYNNHILDWFKMKSIVEWTETSEPWSKTLKFRNVFDLTSSWNLTLDVTLIETADEPSALSNTRNMDQVWVGAVYDF